MKQCRLCGEWKPESEFRKWRRQCKDCLREYDKKYREKNRGENKEKTKEYNKEYYQKNKKKIKNTSKNYRGKNRNKILKYLKRYSKTHKKQRQEYTKMKRKNPKHRLNHCISTSIRKSLKYKKNGHRWEDLVGYTLQDLMNRLENQFTSEMSWDNRGKLWQIDHIIPISAFNFSSPSHLDFKRCWALNNLQPLKKIQNHRKYNKIGGSFQPNLKI